MAGNREYRRRDALTAVLDAYDPTRHDARQARWPAASDATTDAL
jgi:hypothetical protein